MISPKPSLQINWNKKLLYFLALVEGGVVMNIEILSIRMIAPFFGTSIFTWSAVFGITLAGLATGYFIGGRFKAYPTFLFNILFTLSLLLTFLPIASPAILATFINKGIITGTIFATLTIVFPLTFLLGMICPLIVQLLTVSTNQVGKESGRVFGISALSGIFFTFLTGFFLVPVAGLNFTFYFTAIMMTIIPLLISIRHRYPITSIVLFLSIMLQLSKLTSEEKFFIRKNNKPYINMLFRKNSLLGQLIIADDNFAHTRSLLINNISQSFMNKVSGKSVWKYIFRLATYCSVKPEGASVLLGGMGGGLLAKELNDLKFNTDVIEIDPRMEEIAQHYFDLKTKYNFIEDDFRHYVKTCEKVYDIIIIDISFGENQPSHIYTLESFGEIKKILKPDGFLFIHYPDFYKGEKSIAIKSIGKTLQNAGFVTKMINTDPAENRPTEMIFFATNTSFDLGKQDFSRASEFAKKYNFTTTGNVYLNNYTFDEGFILSDNQPQMDFLHENTLMISRKEGIEIITKTLLTQGYTIW